MTSKHAICLSLALTLFETSHALELSPLFSDRVVMQRGAQVPVWGWAEPGEDITVSIDLQSKTARASAAGKWQVRLDPMETGGPRVMRVCGKTDTLEVRDILLGEVWICGGQSNMEWPLTASLNGKAEASEARYPELRLFEVGNGIAPEGTVERLQPDLKRSCAWKTCDPSAAAHFSAVGYYFGRDVHQALKTPVGLIYNAVGATPAEAWISREALLADPDLRFILQRWNRLVQHSRTAQGIDELENLFAAYNQRQTEAVAKGGWFWRSDAFQEPSKRLGFPSTFFNSRVNPLIPFAIRGVLWYQGEGNTEMAYAYRTLFPSLIRDWRDRWGQGAFPFLYVQLANWSNIQNKEPADSEWAELRESQLQTLHVTNTAMAVAIDIGDADNIHPQNKQEVGRRLALAARATVYGEPVEFSGPVYKGMEIEGNAIRISFDHVGGGLTAHSGALKHFAISGDDRRFVWASATIDGPSVVVSSPEIPHPVAVRYAWSHNPKGCNLYNQANLPASPFRTDTWPGATTMKNYRSLLNKPVSFPIPR